MKIAKKIIAGDELRPTRFHTEAGAFVGWTMLPGLVPAAVSWVRHRMTGKCLHRPWWAWEAIKFVEQNIRTNDRVLEVGSGYSSIWLAHRCGDVLSIEESSEWRERVSAEAKRNQLQNLTIIEGDSFGVFARSLNENEHDVVVIDGPRDRLEIFDKLVNMKKEKQPRLIVYDYTDKTENRNALSRSALGYEKHVFRGFKPQTVHACETTVFRV